MCRLQPHLDFRLLTDPRDVSRYREAVRRTAAIFDHPAFGGLLAERLAPTDADLASDDALDAWLQRNAGDRRAYVGHLQDGAGVRPTAVVDQQCRVHGLAGLRVVDASVMPDIVRANTNATIIMIAERVADFIRQGR